MHVSFTDEELAFQQEVRTFLGEEYPEDIRRKQDSGKPLSRDDIIRANDGAFIGVAADY